MNENNRKVCLDTNIWIKFFVPEEKSETVNDLFRFWLEDFTTFIAPSIFLFEFSSTLRKKEKFHSLKEGDGLAILKALYEHSIVLYQSEDFMSLTWDLAQKMEETVLYDVGYLALASWQKVPFYTADEKFFNKAKKFYPEIHLI